METVSYIKAAQQLGVSVEAIHKMIKAKQLKEVSEGRVSKDAVYALSGLSPNGKQTKKQGAGRKPNVMSLEGAAAYLGIDPVELQQLVDGDEIDAAEGPGGLMGVKEAMVKMYKKKLDGREEKTLNGAKMRTAKAQPLPEAKTVGKETKEEEPKKATPKKEEVKKEDEGKHDFNLAEVMKTLFPGVQLLANEIREAGLRERASTEAKYSKEDMKEVAEFAYMKGKLAVYESMGEFKRKERA